MAIAGGIGGKPLPDCRIGGKVVPALKSAGRPASGKLRTSNSSGCVAISMGCVCTFRPKTPSKKGSSKGPPRRRRSPSVMIAPRTVGASR